MRGSLERHRLEPFLLPDLAYFVDLPDEIGPRRHRRHEIGRNRDRLVLVEQCRLHQVEPPLSGWVDDGYLHRMQCALGEGRERTHLFDHVSPELDAKRFAPGRGKDVDEPAPNRELTALVRALYAFVAGERERLGKLLKADLLFGGQTDRLGTRRDRWHRLGECSCRGDDEPAGREDVERTGPLPDEMRCRIEARTPVDAAARKHCDAFLAEKPRRALGGIARILILRREQDKRTVELLVQRCEQERQRRLGDARSSRKGLGKALEPLALAQCLDEWMQDRLVHD